MKVYFTAAHCCGKSTLSRYISEKYKLPMISETARMVLSERELQIDSLRRDISLVDNYQTEVFHRQISEELKYDKFVSDRCALDVLAYSAQHARILPNLLKSKELKSYIEKLKQKDSFIFFIRPSKDLLKEDGVREHLTWDGIIAIDSMIKLLCEMFEVRYFQIDASNMQERIRLIESVLSL